MINALTITDLAENDINAIAFRDYLNSPHGVVRVYAECLEKAGSALAEHSSEEAEFWIAEANALYDNCVERAYGINYDCWTGKYTNETNVGEKACNTWQGDLWEYTPSSKRVASNLAYLAHLANCYEDAMNERFNFVIWL